MIKMNLNLNRLKILTLLTMITFFSNTVIPVYASKDAGGTYINLRALHYYNKVITTYDTSLFLIILACLLICMFLSCKKEKQFEYFVSAFKIFMLSSFILNAIFAVWNTITWIVKLFDGRAV